MGQPAKPAESGDPGADRLGAVAIWCLAQSRDLQQGCRASRLESCGRSLLASALNDH
jgi:hypothetical protein